MTHLVVWLQKRLPSGYVALHHQYGKRLLDMQCQAHSLVSEAQPAGVIVEGMEQCIVEALLRLSRLAEHVSEYLGNHVDVLALKRDAPPGSRDLSDAKVWQ